MAERQALNSDFIPEAAQSARRGMPDVNAKGPQNLLERIIPSAQAPAARERRAEIRKNLNKGAGAAAAATIAVGGTAGAFALDHATKTPVAEAEGFVQVGEGTQSAFNRALDEAETETGIDFNQNIVLDMAADNAHAELNKELSDENGIVQPGADFNVTVYQGGVFGTPYVEAHADKPKLTDETKN